MALREFRDDRGRTWQVWDTHPTSAQLKVDRKLKGRVTGGWLTFTSGAERRRLVPIPRGWAKAKEPALRAWLLAARDANPG